MAQEKETRVFEAEVSQVLRLMIHAMYSNKEVFLRELVSNASDAIDKLRFEALADASLRADQGEPVITITIDKEARTLTIADNGIGMSRDEVTRSIGTIASSGTREFLERLSGDQKADANLIGQFGVGFYSAFIVAERVVLTTRRAGHQEAVRWESRGEGDYTLEAAEKAEVGTEIVLHLREDEDEFLEPLRIETVIRRYSDHISFPIMLVETLEDGADHDGAEKDLEDTRQLNQASALWTRSSAEISEEDYTEFYRHVARAFDEPLTRVHTTVEGRLKFTLLLFVPSARPFDLAMGGQERSGGVKLYVKRVFIMDEAEVFLPRYLRFVRGVVDSDDLPLNVSRELLQDNRVVRSMRQTAVKKVLEALEELSADAEKYATFWKAFGPILKEGVIEDGDRREQVASLLRFASTSTEGAEQTLSLAQYIERMRPGQDAIYYVTADSYQAALASPHLEIFKARGVEVLVLTDAVDEWLVNHLSDFEGKALRSVARGALDLESLGESSEEQTSEEGEDKGDAAESEESSESQEAPAPWLGEVGELLGERVREVRLSKRLTDSPSCLVREEWEIGERMRRILEQAGESVPSSAPILELNEKHPLVARLVSESDSERRRRFAELLLDQARLAEGGQLDAPALFVRRLNDLLLELLSEDRAEVD
ncbi:molecular chaperone HtpG [Lujinxingia sediminis]|uniref:Chaperone protein HtpG n=1 Tax=Lujinxingia sediminis TaxID=2480984 RepID=A0ABY0CRW3_9DELT|nr:molecular chaperone HtpG [Lujinxingia sediminis]RVU42893.1 molecular chaperone HtpG [Lujinxingia sediminis]